MNKEELERKRFFSLLEIAQREGQMLLQTDARLFKLDIDAAWVERLKNEEELSERLEAFVSRFGRMQDTLGDKLLPSLLRLLVENPGSVLDNLNRAEKLGLLTSVVDWRNARNLRNQLIHEYMDDAEEFALALTNAHAAVHLLVSAYNAINTFSRARIAAPIWPNLLPVDSAIHYLDSAIAESEITNSS